MGVTPASPSLQLHKALSDATRLALYDLLCASQQPLSAPLLAAELSVHPNTVRMHLDRLIEAGLVQSTPVHRGSVGRPELRYAALPDRRVQVEIPTTVTAPSSAETALMVHLLASIATRAGATADDARTVGWQWGRTLAADLAELEPVAALVTANHRAGFASVQPVAAVDMAGSPTAIAMEFTECPFRVGLDGDADLLCEAHLGMCDAVLHRDGGSPEGAPFSDGTITQCSSFTANGTCRVSVTQHRKELHP
jgi:predicted ArsR family transcriptional regulator